MGLARPQALYVIAEVDGNSVEEREEKEKSTTESEDGSFVTQVMGYGRKGM